MLMLVDKLKYTNSNKFLIFKTCIPHYVNINFQKKISFQKTDLQRKSRV